MKKDMNQKDTTKKFETKSICENEMQSFSYSHLILILCDFIIEIFMSY